MSFSSSATVESGGPLQNRDMSDLLTLGTDVEFRSEAERASGDVGGESPKKVRLGRFGGFLGLFVERVVHLGVGCKKETKVADPQHQTPPFCLSTGVAIGRISSAARCGTDKRTRR